MTAPLKIIKPAGIIDSVKANELCNQVSALLATGNNLVLLDMTDVCSIDSSGLSALIIALKMLRTAGGNLYLCSIAAPVRDLLNVTRMDRLFEQPHDSQFEHYRQDTEYSGLKSC
jgi:anti-anti-sigma factor